MHCHWIMSVRSGRGSPNEYKKKGKCNKLSIIHCISPRFPTGKIPLYGNALWFKAWPHRGFVLYFPKTVTPSELEPAFCMCSFKGTCTLNDNLSRMSPDLLLTWPNYCSLYLSILVASGGWSPRMDSMCSLVMWSLHDIPCSFLQHHISKADIAPLSAFPNVHVSQPWSSYLENQCLHYTDLRGQGEVPVLQDILQCWGRCFSHGQSSLDIYRASILLKKSLAREH